MKLEDLKGLGEERIRKLNEIGIYTIDELMATPRRVLEKALGDQMIEKIYEQIYDQDDLVTAEEYYDKKKKIEYISTGVEKLDELLGGGIETKATTEMYGEFGSGKSQLGFQLAVMVQKPKEEGGLEGKTIFIDTENTFSPERIEQIAQAKGVEEALKNIYVARVFTAEHQIAILKKIKDRIREDGNIRLIIIDSLMARFRSEYLGIDTLSHRQQKLNEYLQELLRIAEEYNIAIYYTNQVMEMPAVFGDPIKPVGGSVLAHFSTYRMYIRKAKKDKRVIRMVDSPKHENFEVLVEITKEGVIDG